MSLYLRKSQGSKPSPLPLGNFKDKKSHSPPSAKQKQSSLNQKSHQHSSSNSDSSSSTDEETRKKNRRVQKYYDESDDDVDDTYSNSHHHNNRNKKGMMAGGDDSDEYMNSLRTKEFRNQLKEHERYDQAGNELFIADYTEYQQFGEVIELKFSNHGSKGVRTKTMTLKFEKPPNSPEDFTIPNLTVKETIDGLVYIDHKIEQFDWVYKEVKDGRDCWNRANKKSDEMKREREEAARQAGKGKVMRVTLNTERMLGPTGMPSLYHEVPMICAEHLKNAMITTIKEQSGLSNNHGRKGVLPENTAAGGIQSLRHQVSATHTKSPFALSIENSLVNLNAMIAGVYLWKQQLLPKVQTNEFIRRILTLGVDSTLNQKMGSFVFENFKNEVDPRVQSRDDRLERRWEIRDKRRVQSDPAMALRIAEERRSKKLQSKLKMEQDLQDNILKAKEHNDRRQKLEDAKEEKLRSKLERQRLKEERHARGSTKKKSTRQGSRWDDSDSDQLYDSSSEQYNSDSDDNSDQSSFGSGSEDDKSNQIRRRKDNTKSSYEQSPHRSTPRRSQYINPRLYNDNTDESDEDLSIGLFGSVGSKVNRDNTNVHKGEEDENDQDEHTPTKKVRQQMDILTKRVIIEDDDCDDEYDRQFMSRRAERRASRLITDKNNVNDVQLAPPRTPNPTVHHNDDINSSSNNNDEDDIVFQTRFASCTSMYEDDSD